MWRRDADRRAEAHERKKEKFDKLMEILRKQHSETSEEISRQIPGDTSEADKASKSS